VGRSGLRRGRQRASARIRRKAERVLLSLGDDEPACARDARGNGHLPVVVERAPQRVWDSPVRALRLDYLSEEMVSLFLPADLLQRQDHLAGALEPDVVLVAVEVERVDRGARVQEALKRVGLGARLSHRPAELSGGEQQRASLARALVNRPTILFADEPTGNLDSRTGEEIMNFIQQFNKELGMTVIMVTHEAQLAKRYAARHFYLKDGKLSSNGDAQ